MIYKILIYQKGPSEDLHTYLSGRGYKVVSALDRKSMDRAIREDSFDLAITDGYPEETDRYTVIADLKEINPKMAVVFLTGDHVKDDLKNALESGADLFVEKPYSIEDMLYMVRAVLRRTGHCAIPEIYTIGEYRFDTRTKELVIGDRITKLADKPAQLLGLLYLYKDSVLPRALALQTIWTDTTYFNARSMDVVISKLRKFLSLDPKIHIDNVHAQGYTLIVDE